LKAGRVRFRRSTTTIVLCTLAMLTYSVVHLSAFGEALRQTRWLNLFGYTRVIIPDTFTYFWIAQVDSIPALFSKAQIKNSFGPALLWWLSGNNWYLLSYFNAMCFALTLVYTRSLITLLDPAQLRRFKWIAFVLTVASCYYSVGALKEIPTLLGFTAFVYHFVARQKMPAIVWFGFLTLFRYQFLYLVVPAYAIRGFRRNPLPLTLAALGLLGILFPVVSYWQVFTPDAIGYFRGGAAEPTVGAQVEFVRGNVLFFSLPAILLRVVQTIFEPLFQLLATRTVYEQGALSLMLVQALLALLLLTPAWVTVFSKRLWRRLGTDRTSARFGTLYALIALSVSVP
jgi:hypothetical protein